MATHQLDIPVTRQFDHGELDGCLACLKRRVGMARGIAEVGLRSDGEGAVSLTIDYDPRLVTLTELESQVRHAGVCLCITRVQRLLTVEGMFSPTTERTVEAALAQLPTVVASASFAAQTVRVEFDRERCAFPRIVERLERLGLRVTGEREAGPEGEMLPTPAPLPAAGGAAAATMAAVARAAIAEAEVEGPPAEVTEAAPERQVPKWLHLAREYPKLALAAVGGVLVLASFVVHHYNGPVLLRLALSVPAYVLCGWFTFQDTLRTLRQRQFEVDVLMFAAALGAALLGHYEEGALLLFLFAIGTGGEEVAMDRARNAIQALAKLAPEKATVRTPDGRERVVKVEELNVDDTVVVRPFDRLPADGKVLTGTSAVDQAPITGESVPVEKGPGDTVFAGTINGDGLLAVAVSRRADQSTLARVIRMVNEAQTAKSPTQVFTDRVERWYVPAVMIGTVGVAVIPPLVAGMAWGHWVTWFYRAMAFLTAASPCALAIGTPAAVLSGIARAARIGVLIKGGVHLENLGRVRVVAFDKTGTLTRGKPELVDVVPLNGMAEDDVLRFAGAVERKSSHPLAKAIAAAAAARGANSVEAEDVGQVPGKGMTARVAGRALAVGALSMFPADAPSLEAARQAVARLSSEGKTTVAVSIDGRLEAVLALADRPRANAASALQRLRTLGVERSVMLTGDHATVAAAMAKEVGVDEFMGDLLPEGKVDAVRTLCDRHGTVAMVGDGVNDAPAMAGATVGIAMGGAGTDVALETADVALMADDLDKLPDAIGLSRFSRRIIKQNLAIALGVIAVVSPIAALGGANLSMAVLLHEGSTVVVVCNALRLLLYRPRA